MNIVTGDETGLLKLVNLKKKEILSRFGTQTRANAVAQVASVPAGAGSSSALYAALSRAGVVEVYDPVSERRLHRCAGAGEDAVHLSAFAGRFMTVCPEGAVRLFSQAALDADAKETVTWNVGKNVKAARFHAPSGTLALGGWRHELQLWDVAARSQAWEAENVENDWLDRPVPVSVAGLQFLGGGEGSDRPHTLVTVSALKFVRIYDTRAQRRPVRETTLGDFPYTCVDVSSDGKHIIAGDTIGTLRRFDVGTLHETGGYHGTAGAITALAVHPTLPYFAEVGLDRCLRVFHVETRALLRRVYLKQRLNAVVWAASEPKKAAVVASEMVPEPLPSHQIRVTTGPEVVPATITGYKSKDMAEALRKRLGLPEEKKLGIVGAHAPKPLKRDEDDEDGEEDEEEDDASIDSEDPDAVWEELDRRAQVAAKGGLAGTKRKRPADEEEDSEEEEEEDSEEDEEEEDDSDDLSIDEDELPKERRRVAPRKGRGDDDDEEEDDDDDDDDDRSADDSDDGEPSVDSEEEAAAFVDSAAAARRMKGDVNKARREAAKVARRAVSKGGKAQGAKGGKGGAKPPPAKRPPPKGGRK